MVRWKRHALDGGVLVVVLACYSAAFIAMYGRFGVSGEEATALLIGGATFGSIAWAIYQHHAIGREKDERQVQILYHSFTVSFFAVYWFLFILAMGSLGAGPVDFHLDTGSLVLLLWTVATVVLFGSRLWYRRKY